MVKEVVLEALACLAKVAFLNFLSLLLWPQKPLLTSLCSLCQFHLILCGGHRFSVVVFCSNSKVLSSISFTLVVICFTVGIFIHVRSALVVFSSICSALVIVGSVCSTLFSGYTLFP